MSESEAQMGVRAGNKLLAVTGVPVMPTRAAEKYVQTAVCGPGPGPSNRWRWDWWSREVTNEVEGKS